MANWHDGAGIVTPSHDAKVMVRNDPGGADSQTHTSRDALLRREHAGLFVADGVASQVIPDSTGWHKLTQFTNASPTHEFGASVDDSEITIGAVGGRVQVSYHVAFLGVAFVIYQFGVRINGTVQPILQDRVQVRGGDGYGRVGVSMPIGVIAADVLDLAVKVSAASSTVAVFDMGLSAARIY